MTTSAIDHQIMWNRLIAVVEEQATTLVRTAFSTSVREAGDLSAGLFDRRARMMAQAVTGTPGHVNAMAESVAHFVREIGQQNMFEGDVYLTNDPWKGTGHLHDITVVSPVFHGGVHIGFFACTAHVVDVGGRGFGPDANEVYEEGILIPIMKFAERGKVSADLLRIIRANVREPVQLVGDLYSLAVCNEAGDRRLQDTMGEFGIDDLEALSDYIYETSRKATLAAISEVPDGSYPNEMQVDGYDAPVTMVVVLTVNGDQLTADFAGTSGMSRFGVNVPEVYTRAYSCFGLKCAIAPHVPNNTGSLEPFHITAPEGCILAAKRPAPVSVRHILGHFLPDLVLGALHQAMPGSVPAEGASALWSIQISSRPSDPISGLPNSEVLMFHSGGTGARPETDGLSATAFPSGVSTMSVEATEHVSPITVWRKDLRQGSGGAGTRRGGLGQTVEIEPREGYDFYFNAMFDRVDNAARGRDGGASGERGYVELTDGTVMRGKGRQLVKNGQRLRLLLPGGGGYGKAIDRDTAQVRADLVADYITNDQARQDYTLED
jgi:N-methylhydantoinase B